MLSERQCELLTAFVDGELSSRQRKLVLRLLRRSLDARRLLKELQRDSRQLAALPRKHPPKELPHQVMSSIAAQGGLVPTTPSILAETPAAAGSWVPLALAASVLIAVSFASYLYFAGTGSKQQQNPPVAQNPPAPNRGPVLTEDGLAALGAVGEALSGKYVLPQLHQLLEQEAAVWAKMIPPAPKVQFALKDLKKKPEVRNKLTEELLKDTAFQVNLSSGDNRKAVKQLESAFQKNGIKLLVDEQAQKTMKKGGKAIFVVYVEDLSPFDVPAILDGLADQSGGKNSTIHRVALNTMSPEKRSEMAMFLGVPVQELAPARNKVHLPVPSGNNVIIPAPGKNPPANDTKGQPENAAPAHPDRLAVMLAYDPEVLGKSSQQINSFLHERKSVRPDGTLQLVIVLQESQA